MHQNYSDPKIKSIIYIISLIIAGTAYAGFAKLVFEVESDAAQVVFILLPLIAYLVLEGKLREVIMPGGFSAKFTNIGQQPIELSSEKIEDSLEKLQVMEKDGLNKLWSQIEDTDTSKPTVLTAKMGTRGFYERGVWFKYMEALSQLRTFKFVVILDRYGRFLAYIHALVLLHILNDEIRGENFVKIINSDNTDDLLRFKGLIKNKILNTAKNVEA